MLSIKKHWIKEAWDIYEKSSEINQDIHIKSTVVGSTYGFRAFYLYH